MRRFFIGAAAAALMLVLATGAEAAPKGGPKGHPGGSHHGGSHHGGSHHKGGHSHKSWKGKHGHHWSQHRYDRHYGCTVYFDPDSACWCYWCPPDDCYYPVDYCPYGRYSWDN